MFGDGLRVVIGQAKQIHQSCCLLGRSVMNNLSCMTDVLDVCSAPFTAEVWEMMLKLLKVNGASRLMIRSLN